MKKTLATALLAGAMLLAVPTTAHAYGEAVPGTDTSVGTSTTITFGNFPSGTEDVTVVVDGPGVATLAALSAPKTYAVSPSGTITVTASFPASGTYTFTLTDADTGATLNTLAVTATVADSDGLADTGFDAAPYLWFGGGTLALGTALIVVLSIVRRNRTKATVDA